MKYVMVVSMKIFFPPWLGSTHPPADVIAKKIAGHNRSFPAITRIEFPQDTRHFIRSKPKLLIALLLSIIASIVMAPKGEMVLNTLSHEI